MNIIFLFSGLCPILNDTAIIKFRCQHDKVDIKCTEASEGTIVNVECASYYEPSNRLAGKCSQGRWNLLPRCIPSHLVVNIQININEYHICTSNCTDNIEQNSNSSKPNESSAIVFIDD